MTYHRYDFWTHGVATVLESPELARLLQHRTDIGTVVEQDAGTSAWFHLAIPSAPMLTGSGTAMRQFALAATVSAGARLDVIHIRRGMDLVYERATAYTGTVIDSVVFDLVPDVNMSARKGGSGIAISLHVQFRSGAPRGRFELHGAGATFSDRPL
jgi:hypothetical protein